MDGLRCARRQPSACGSDFDYAVTGVRVSQLRSHYGTSQVDGLARRERIVMYCIDWYRIPASFCERPLAAGWEEHATKIGLRRIAPVAALNTRIRAPPASATYSSCPQGRQRDPGQILQLSIAPAVQAQLPHKRASCDTQHLCLTLSVVSNEHLYIELYDSISIVTIVDRVQQIFQLESTFSRISARPRSDPASPTSE